MALNLVSNFAANVAHRNLARVDMQTTSSLAKLSSGSRVVSAKDDAASLAVGSRLRAEVEALKQANVNAGQASSMLQIADGALSTISDILVRMKSLSVQSGSGQLGQTERNVLDAEFQALKDEITRISNDTEFNGTQLIAGGSAVFTNGQSATTSELAGGVAPGISITFDSATFDAGIILTDTVYRISFDFTSVTSQNLTLTNLQTGDRQTIDIRVALDSIVTGRGGTADTGDLVAGESLEVNFSQLGVTVSLDEFFDRDADIITEGAQTVTTVGADITVTGSISAEYATSGLTNAGLTELLGLAGYDAATGLLTILVDVNTTANTIVMAVGGTAGLEFDVDGTGSFAVAPTTDIEDGEIHTIAIQLATSNETIATITVDNILSNSDNTDKTLVIDIGRLMFGTDFTSTGTSTDFTFKVGSGVESYDDLTFTVRAASATVLALNNNDVLTADKSDVASAAISTAIDTINSNRSDIGAAQNRLAFASSNLAASIENAEAARSSLLDLDIAAEISVFTSKQVLLQAGVAMLAQANQLPSNLLQLLR